MKLSIKGNVECKFEDNKIVFKSFPSFKIKKLHNYKEWDHFDILEFDGNTYKIKFDNARVDTVYIKDWLKNFNHNLIPRYELIVEGTKHLNEPEELEMIDYIEALKGNACITFINSNEFSLPKSTENILKAICLKTNFSKVLYLTNDGGIYILQKIAGYSESVQKSIKKIHLSLNNDNLDVICLLIMQLVNSIQYVIHLEYSDNLKILDPLIKLLDYDNRIIIEADSNEGTLTRYPEIGSFCQLYPNI